VPAVLGAVKRAVDDDPHPGRFLLTGSVRAELEGDMWPGTGRLVRLPLYGMSVREQSGLTGRRPFLDVLADGDPPPTPAVQPDLREYVATALRSGFPDPALRIGTTGARERWLESYVEQLIGRDAAQLGERRDPALLRRYLEAYALNSGGVLDHLTISEAATINRKTADAYEHLLEALLVVERVPAWTSNRFKRLVLMPKRYVIDAALIAAVLRADEQTVLRDGHLLGRLLDTFVAAQLRPELVAATSRPRLHHLRMEQGRHEVDLVAELSGRRILGIEVKASAAPGSDDARHLAWLRDRAGDAFTCGVVLHTGPRVFSLGDRLWAAPIASLWA
jgi:predicted AAA+ superfamily ATPase